MRTLVLAALLTATASWMSAQSRVASPVHFNPPAHSGASNSPAMSGSLTSRPDFHAFRGLPRSSFSRPLLNSLGFFSDSFYPDASSYPAAAQPLVIMMQAPLTAALNQDQPQPLLHPLVIELQAGRYVRLPDADAEDSAPVSRDPAASGFAARSARITATEEDAVQSARRKESGHLSSTTLTAREPAPAVLMFRDGHSEEIRDYTIADGFIYARGDYYNDGYWNKKIDLSALNLPETVKSNQARGVRFLLPSAPNVVTVGP